MLLEKKKAQCFRRMQGSPTDVAHFPGCYFQLSIPAFYFGTWLASFCSFPLTCSYLSFLYNAFQAAFFFTFQRKFKECWLVQELLWHQPSSWFENNLRNPGSWLTFQLFNESALKGSETTDQQILNIIFIKLFMACRRNWRNLKMNSVF